MLGLNLDARSIIKLPASALPGRADVYVCDKCERNITKYLRPGKAHVWRSIGTERYRCRCGERFLTGAVEWDHLSGWERKQRVAGTIWIGVGLSVLFSPVSLAAYLALRFVYGLHHEAVVTAWVITAIPFVLMQLACWPAVMASMWRTRIASSADSQRR